MPDEEILRRLLALNLEKAPSRNKRRTAGADFCCQGQHGVT
jgi:hypothetical protein